MEIEDNIFNFEDFLNGSESKSNTDSKQKKEDQPKPIEKVVESPKIIEKVEKPEPEVIKQIEPINEDLIEDEFYKVFKDKSEIFACDIQIEGADLSETSARLILETDSWTIMFNGTITNGKCSIPIKKLNIFDEGQTGKIKLEVIAEGNLFIPWEDTFRVKLSKKVNVKLNETKVVKESGIKVQVHR